MTLINITLTEDEQDFLLRRYDINLLINTPPHPEWASIAEKIRRAQDDSMFTEDMLPPHPRCAVCGIPRDEHPGFPGNDARPESDHAWRWNTVKEPHADTTQH